MCLKRCLEAIAVQYYRLHYCNAYISVDNWIDLFSRELDVNMESYRPESLPPRGRYIFRAVIGNELGNNSYNYSTEFDIPEGEQCVSLCDHINSDIIVITQPYLDNLVNPKHLK